MKFEELTTEDFRRLNLSPLHQRRNIVWALKKEKVYIHYDKLYKKYAYGDAIQSTNDRYEFCGTIEIKNFLDITEEQFRDIFGIGKTSLPKYLWLQKYLKGEVNGVYQPDCEIAVQLLESEEISKLKKKIDDLSEKLAKTSSELAQERKNNKELTKAIKDLERARKAIQQIKSMEI